MKRLQMIIFAAMVVTAITVAAWPSNTTPDQTATAPTLSVTETPKTAPESPAFVNETKETAISETESPTSSPAPALAQTPEPEHYDEVTDPTFTGYPTYKEYSEAEITMLAQTVYGEAGICSADEQRLVIWTILQRVDDERFPDTIAEVITAENQFAGYHTTNPVEEDILDLCHKELGDWYHGAEPPTMAPYATAAPYLYFDGDGRHNWFREVWE